MDKIHKYLMTPEDIKNISSIAVEEGIKAFKKEQAKTKTSKIKKTKEILSSYRRIKATLKNEAEFSEEEKIEIRWRFIEDLMGDVNGIAEKSDRTISDREKRRQENFYCIDCVNKAAALYKDECEKSKNPEAMRRYREFEMFYLTDKEYSAKDISLKEKISEKTVYKDIGKATRIIAVYLLGADLRI